MPKLVMSRTCGEVRAARGEAGWRRSSGGVVGFAIEVHTCSASDPAVESRLAVSGRVVAGHRAAILLWI